MKRTFLILVVLILFVTFHPRSIAAGTISAANIIAIDVENDGIFLIDISQPTSGAPACATVTNRLTGNSNTAGGKALLQLAISVYLSGRPVEVDGTGACTEAFKFESIARIYAR